MPALPTVTDHALVRWLERVHQMPIETFRKALAETVGPVTGVGEVVVRKEGMKYLVRNDALITVIEQGENPAIGWASHV